MAALAEIERRLEETGHIWTSAGCFKALDRLPRNLGKTVRDSVILEATRIADIAGLAGLPATRILSVGDQVTDIAVVAALPNLEIFRASRARDISPLRYCDKLNDVTLNVQAMADLSPLQDVPTLETLSIIATMDRGYRHCGRSEHFMSKVRPGFALARRSTLRRCRLTVSYAISAFPGPRRKICPRLCRIWNCCNWIAPGWQVSKPSGAIPRLIA